MGKSLILITVVKLQCFDNPLGPMTMHTYTNIQSNIM